MGQRRPTVPGRLVKLLLPLLILSQHALHIAAASGWEKGRDAVKAAAKQHADKRWRASRHRLQNMMLDKHRLGEFLGHIMQHEFVLPLEQMQKSLVYTGSNFRLRKVVHDLILGKRPIRVGAIGGSITNGAKASKVGETDWFSLVGTYLRSAFPRANITTRNGALPATPSALMNMCLEQYVDDNVDLVFVEYVANDGSNRFDEVKAKVYERLLRKLLNRPSKPALVLLQLMPKGMAFGPGRRDKVPFHATMEDVYGAQAQYYDLPWLSFRNAMWRLTELHHHGYNWTDFMWDVDFMHPIDPGMAVVADMVAYLMQQTALSLLLHPLGHADKELLRERLPDPMFNNNWEAKNLMCTYGEGFKPLVDATASPGWSFVDEGRPGAPKWGFVSKTPGSVLKIRVNSMRDQKGPGAQGGSKQEKEKPMNVMLAYLKSYEGMGIANFECTSGCVCEAKTNVDALHSLKQSTIYLVRLLVSQAKTCEISVTLLKQTNSKGHKFKVSGIMMNEYIGADITEKLHEEQWLSQLQETARGGGDRAVGDGKAAAAARDASAASDSDDDGDDDDAALSLSEPAAAEEGAAKEAGVEPAARDGAGEDAIKQEAKRSIASGAASAGAVQQEKGGTVVAAAATTTAPAAAGGSPNDRRRRRHLLSGLAAQVQQAQHRLQRRLASTVLARHR